MSSGGQAPIVSVFMTTYKEEWLRLARAIDSILDQTFSDLEFIVVFEADDPNCARVQQAYTDPRLIVVRLTDGRGRSACHNLGVEMAKGRYLAPMDGDDISLPHRLSTAVDYLRANPDIGVVGGSARLLDNAGTPVGVRQVPCDHATLQSHFALTNPIFHSAAIWDRERTGPYRYEGFYSDDLELWLHMLVNGVRFANVPEVLLDYRQPPDYGRPRGHWRGTFLVRLKHWRLGFRNPMFFVGVVTFGLFSILPKPWAIAISRRNAFSDHLRSINNVNRPARKA